MLKGFISYSSIDRRRAAEVKRALSELGVDAFMAHDDITVSQEWRNRILTELRAMEVFVPLLSAAFKTSEWTAQEVGVAVARKKVLIIPASLVGTVPFGFIGAFQGRLLPSPATSEFFREPLARRFPRHTVGLLIEALGESGSWRGAESNFRLLLPFLDGLTPEEADRVATLSARNSEIWNASLCRSEYLPRFIAGNRHRISAPALRELERRLEHGWDYPDDETDPQSDADP